MPEDSSPPAVTSAPSNDPVVSDRPPPIPTDPDPVPEAGRSNKGKGPAEIQDVPRFEASDAVELGGGLPNTRLLHQTTARTVRRLMFPAAAQPEIIRANQKDLYYLSELREQVENVTRGLMGTRWLQVWGEEVREASRLAYFSLTTLLGSQTLGEEYCDIVQYSASTGDLPSKQRRATLVLAHILLPYIISKVYSRFRRQMSAIRERASEPATSLRAKLASIEWPSFESLVHDHLRAGHLAVFYLTGKYYHWAKRAVGIRYISTQNRRPGADTQPPSYEVLGVLMAIQLLVRITRGLLARRRRLREEATATLKASSGATETHVESSSAQGKGKGHLSKPTVDGVTVDSLTFDPDDPSPPLDEDAPMSKYVTGTTNDVDGDENDDEEWDESDDDDDEEVPAADSHARRCTLCLGPRRDPTATECGHVFCWECVVGWAREKPVCPLCRQNIELSSLLPLYNL